MKHYFRIAIVLLITAACSGALLSIANMMAKNKIAQNQKQAIENGIRTIEPEAELITEKETDLYEVSNKDGQKLGYVFLTQGQGYQGSIKILCGVDSGLNNILGIEIIESTETPGLGARINEAWFKKQFKSLNVARAIEYVKRKPQVDNEIEAITGATVSSKAVVTILNIAIKELREKLK